MGGIVSKRKLNNISIQRIINESFIVFGYACDTEEMTKLNLNPDGNNNLVPDIFLNPSVEFSYACINNQFNSKDFYSYLSGQIIELVKNESAEFLGFIPVPAIFANVTYDSAAIQDSIYKMYYNFNSQCNILSFDTLMDFNVDGSYNHVTSATANQVMNSFGTCQTTETNQKSAVSLLQEELFTATEVSPSWFSWVFLAIMIIFILIIIIAVVWAAMRSGKSETGNEDEILEKYSLNQL